MASTYYINADTGNDTTGAGTSASPWQTLSKAIAASAAGDTIYCQNATATYLFTNQTIGSRTITGQSTSGVVFDGAAANVAWTFSSTTTITISNLTIQNITHTAATSVLRLDRTSTNSLTITNCIFKDIVLFGDIGWVFGKVVGLTGMSTAGGIFTITITSCLFYNITKNSGTTGTYEGIIGGADGSGSTWTVTINNSTVWVNGTSTTQIIVLFFIYAATHTLSFKNFIFKNNSGTAIAWTSSLYGGTGDAMTYSCTNNAAGWADRAVGGTKAPPSGAGNISSDPLFVDETNGNFNLRPTSPCIDAGTLA